MDDVGALFQQKERTGTADFCAASPAYFHALGIPLDSRSAVRRSRSARTTARRASISESLARSRWPGEDPIGRTIEFGNMDGDLTPLTIVGIVGDTREYGLEQPPRPTMYVNLHAAAAIHDDGRDAIERAIAARDDGGRATRAARSGAGRAAALPDVRADLRGVARRAAVQSHARRRVRRHGAAFWRSRASTASWPTTSRGVGARSACGIALGATHGRCRAHHPRPGPRHDRDGHRRGRAGALRSRAGCSRCSSTSHRRIRWRSRRSWRCSSASRAGVLRARSARNARESGRSAETGIDQARPANRSGEMIDSIGSDLPSRTTSATSLAVSGASSTPFR